MNRVLKRVTGGKITVTLEVTLKFMRCQEVMLDDTGQRKSRKPLYFVTFGTI